MLRALDVAWWLALMGWLGILALAWFSGATMWCLEDQGGWQVGDLSWQLVPLGPACSWNEAEHGFTATEGPGWFWTVVSLVLIGSGGLLVGFHADRAGGLDRWWAELRAGPGVRDSVKLGIVGTIAALVFALAYELAA